MKANTPKEKSGIAFSEKSYIRVSFQPDPKQLFIHSLSFSPRLPTFTTNNDLHFPPEQENIGRILAQFKDRIDFIHQMKNELLPFIDKFFFVPKEMSIRCYITSQDGVIEEAEPIFLVFSSSHKISYEFAEGNTSEEDLNLRSTFEYILARSNQQNTVNSILSCWLEAFELLD